MDKKQQKKDKTFEAPSDEIQAKITELMGLPADEAAPSLSKDDAPTTGRKKAKPTAAQVKSDKPIAIEAPTTNLDTSENTIESEATDKAVEDIVHKESDTILEHTDNKPVDLKVKKTKKHKLFSIFWTNKKIRYAILLLLIVGITIIGLIPDTRYAALNTIGVKASTSFSVIDQISGRPVKNVNVDIAGQQAKTSEDGSVKIDNLKLGETKMVLSKRSFETIEQTIIIGWGSNPFQSPFEVLPTGTTFSFVLTDWVDGEPIKEAEVTDGDSIGIANEKGIANITIEPTDEDIEIIVSANGYSNKTVVIPAASVDSQEVILVASKPDVFISQRNGNYDVYKRAIDGNSEELILPGTGSEQDDIYVIGHPTDENTAALVSSRSGIRNQEGYLLSDLYMIDISSKTASKVEGTQSERIRIISWDNDRLVFVKTIAGPSASFANRQRIISYDYKTKSQTELASANYFSDVRLINSKVYYVVSSSTQGDQGTGLVTSEIDGANKKVLIGGNIWGVYRNSPNGLVVSAEGEQWYGYDINTDKISTLEGAPAQVQNKRYINSPNGQKTVLIEKIDGQTELIVQEDSQNIKVARLPGISSPLYWINDKTIVFGVNNSQESARYVVSLNNKEINKIGDNIGSVYSGVPYF